MQRDRISTRGLIVVEAMLIGIAPVMDRDAEQHVDNLEKLTDAGTLPRCGRSFTGPGAGASRVAQAGYRD